MAKIKICGLRREEDIRAVNQFRPDYIGFVFASGRRQIDFKTAEKLRDKLNPSICPVGIFVNEDISFILSLCKAGIIDVIQLHGDESEGYRKELKKALPNKIIQAIRIRDASQIKVAEDNCADYFLLDAWSPAEYGGSGRTFDWTMLSSAHAGVGKPYFLAGGIHSNNIREALRLGNPYCIDVSSGVETDGYKDSDKIRKIIEKVRSI